MEAWPGQGETLTHHRYPDDSRRVQRRDCPGPHLFKVELPLTQTSWVTLWPFQIRRFISLLYWPVLRGTVVASRQFLSPWSLRSPLSMYGHGLHWRDFKYRARAENVCDADALDTLPFPGTGSHGAPHSFTRCGAGQFRARLVYMRMVGNAGL